MHDDDHDARPMTVNHRYLLLSQITTYIDDAGSLWLDELWHKDLKRHFSYIENLALASPVTRLVDPTGLVQLEVPLARRLTLVHLPAPDSFAKAIKSLPRLVASLWKGIGSCDILHSSVVGWPIPVGWIANPIALLRKRKLIIVIESAPWRRPEGSPGNFKQKIRESISEYLARFFVGASDLTIVTHPGYEKTLRQRPENRIHVIPASWIDSEKVISLAEAEQDWAVRSMQPARFLFAGRLHQDKGIQVLLDAIGLSDNENSSISVDFIGEGELRDDIVRAASRQRVASVRMLNPVSYNTEFFDLIKGYHAIVIPSISDEQPRILFDAYSKAIPVVASNTPGMSPYIEDGRNGFLFETGDPMALKKLLVQLASSPERLRDAGLHAIDAASTYTHEHMHRVRQKILLDTFGRLPHN